MLIDLGAARTELEPIEGILIASYETAAMRWRELVTEQPHLALPLGATARAMFIHDHVCPEIERGVEEVPHVQATDALGFFALSIGEGILLRPKYVGQGAPSNVGTTQQRLLAKQEYDEEMIQALGRDPAFAPPTLLTCGYTLDEGELGRIEIRCDFMGKQIWKFDIFGGEAESETLAFPGMEDEARPAVVKSTRKTAAEKGQGLVEEA